MKTLLVMFATIAGLVIGWAVFAFGYLALGSMAGVSHFEGAFAMGAFFMVGPIGGVIGAIVGAVWGIRRKSNK